MIYPAKKYLPDPDLGGSAVTVTLGQNGSIGFGLVFIRCREVVRRINKSFQYRRQLPPE